MTHCSQGTQPGCMCLSPNFSHKEHIVPRHSKNSNSKHVCSKQAYWSGLELQFLISAQQAFFFFWAETTVLRLASITPSSLELSRSFHRLEAKTGGLHTHTTMPHSTPTLTLLPCLHADTLPDRCSPIIIPTSQMRKVSPERNSPLPQVTQQVSNRAR